MNAGSDNLFARWSRRKQDARSRISRTPYEEEPSSEAVAADVNAEPTEQQPAVAEPDTAEPLPRLEDLTAESDLSAFLRKGVPKALKRAALRKMWSLDPAIRDHVGLAEYAWDFNQPGSMAGFGPLDAKEVVVGFLSTMERGIETDTEETAAASEAMLPPVGQPTAASPEQAASASPDDLAEAASADTPLEPQQVAAAAPDRSEVAPDRAQAAAKPRKSRKKIATKPRHGGAMPR
jgi:hypothetical protein